jgi:hypothetical protein
VAHVKSIARPMMTEELIAAGLPAEPEVQELGTSQPADDKTSPIAGGSEEVKDRYGEPERGGVNGSR